VVSNVGGPRSPLGPSGHCATDLQGRASGVKSLEYKLRHRRIEDISAVHLPTNADPSGRGYSHGVRPTVAVGPAVHPRRPAMKNPAEGVGGAILSRLAKSIALDAAHNGAARRLVPPHSCGRRLWAKRRTLSDERTRNNRQAAARRLGFRRMCNLYSLTKGQQSIRDLAGAMRDLTGNLPLFPGIFPDYAAPIVRNAPDGVRELSTARWGMPSPVFALKGRNSDPGVTNVRNVSSPHWRRWLGVESRCVVPLTSFSEHRAEGTGRKACLPFGPLLASEPPFRRKILYYIGFSGAFLSRL
jgi:hypothetical protein